MTSAIRAIWSLVDDRYDVAARTSNLSLDDARRLCRVADMGDPSVPLADAVACLDAEPWGRVFARYYTNAARDSAGRLTIVYDVLHRDDAELRAVRNDPFRVFPPLPDGRTVAPDDALALPPLEPAADEAARLAALLEACDAGQLFGILAAVLHDGPVLWLAQPERADVVEAIVLLLPPSLRPALTFQTHTLVRPAHLPRLTMAVRLEGSLRDVEWSLVMPQDHGRLARRASDAATALLDLAGDPAALARAHRVFEHMGPGAIPAPGILAGVETLLRLHETHALLDAGDVAGTVATLGAAADERERAHVARELAARVDAEQLADGAAEAIERSGDAWSAIATIAVVLSAARKSDRAANAMLDRLVQRVAALPLGDTPESRDARTVLAACAARLGLADAAVVLLPADPRAAALDTSGGVDAAVRDAVPALAPLLRAWLAGTGDASSRIDALAAAAPHLQRRSARQRAAHLASGAARLALRSGAPMSADERRRLAASLRALWTLVPAAGETDDALRRLLDTTPVAPEEDAESARRGPAAASALAKAQPPATGAEVVGWAALLLADAAGRSDRVLVERSGALIGDWRGDAEVPRHLGALLSEYASGGGLDAHRPEWQRLVDLADGATRRALMGRLLADTIHACASGVSTVGAIADACAALAGRGIAIDAALAPAVATALVELRDRDDATAAAGVRLRLAWSAVEQIADGAALDLMESAVWPARPAGAVATAWLWRVSLGVRLAERVRPAERLPALQDALRTAGGAASGLPSSLRAVLDTLLLDGSLLGFIRSRRRARGRPVATASPQRAAGD